MKIKLYIQGVHCKSCEILLEKEIRKIDGVKSCFVSHKNGTAVIESDYHISPDALKKVVSAHGHQIVSENEKHDSKKTRKNSINDYLDIGFIAILLIVAVFVINELGISQYFPKIGSQVSPLIAIALGIVASLSTCLALVGGIVMGFGELYPVHPDSKHPMISRLSPHLYFHVGRIGGFILLGGLLGLIGNKISYSLSFTGWLTIIVAVVMFYIGLQILNLVPNITRFGFHMPKIFSRKINDLENNRNHFVPIIIGALTFFLPCGFTQSMQLAAVASGNFVSGALIMGAFALGTLPALISLGLGSTYAKQNRFGYLNKTIGVVIVFFALYSLNSGMVLAGSPVNLNFWSSGKTANTSVVSDNKDIQVIKMDVDWTFKPTRFTVKKGVPVRWEINGINVSGCSSEVVIPSLNIRKKLSEGLNIIEFTPKKDGTIPFSCGMGMITGSITVND
jgi:sulfite exporter TauE/SafE/copper chaperone CopZ